MPVSCVGIISADSDLCLGIGGPLLFLAVSSCLLRRLLHCRSVYSANWRAYICFFSLYATLGSPRLVLHRLQ
ncbi:hypothetical protein EDD18DRAFT_1121493 [Armillaria luteobubalina]|uniref:Uncharacterized protein n=1 Tax=Armillaria luteobubalina TaxID=153913 RepID=A0AA39QPY9_9AGAR|nr:hypothetical protein EDD18DRAFT_1121493 [Armillaria luteobubalina]